MRPQNLDVQYVAGMATNVSTAFWSVGTQSDGFFDTASYLVGQSSIPQVMTTSYGEGETGISSAYAK
jgi:tripeptidyl-peptidase-1